MFQGNVAAAAAWSAGLAIRPDSPPSAATDYSSPLFRAGAVEVADSRRDQGHQLTVSMEALASPDDALLSAWDDLCERAVEPNPFFSPQLLVPAVRWLPDGASVRLLTVRDGARLVLVLPLVESRYRRVPMTALTTWRHTHRFVGTPVADGECLIDAAEVALDALIEWRLARWLILEQVYLDGPVARAFRMAAAERSANWVTHDWWSRPMAFRETSSAARTIPKASRATQRKRRKLAGTVGHVVAKDVAQNPGERGIAASVESFLALEASGWKGRSRTALASNPDHAMFWREVCHELDRTGRLGLWELRAGERLAAGMTVARQGKTNFQLKIAYDEELANYSPGVLLDIDVVDAFHAHEGVDCIDTCAEKGAAGAGKLFPESKRVGDALIGLTGAGRLMARATPKVASGWRAMKDQRARRKLRGVEPD